MAGRKGLLFLANSLFIVWGGAASFLLLGAFSMLISLLAIGVIRFKTRWALALALILTITPLAVTKYTMFFIHAINTVMDLHVAAPSFIIPMGISFVTFEAISLLVDIFKGKISRTPSPLDIYIYLTFFPTITSGPILRYDEFETGLRSAPLSRDVSTALERICLGLCKKVLVADKIAVLADSYFDGTALGNSYSAMGLWMGSMAYSLQLYFDFSGYSDMAIGIGGLLGFNIRENFNRPYQACGISDFWRRWHLSLTQWFRDYIYIPLGGNRCSPLRHIQNLLVVWLLTGIWHGANWTFILWGLAYFVFLVAEKSILKSGIQLPRLVKHAYTLFIVNLLWVPFRAKDLSTAFQYMAGMFGGGVGVIEKRAIRFVPFMLLAIALCLPWENILHRFNGRQEVLFLKNAVLVILTGLALCSLINSSYAPYIYGNF